MLKSSELTTWSNGGSAKSQELRKGYTNLTNDEQKKKKKKENIQPPQKVVRYVEKKNLPQLYKIWLEN